MSIQTAEDTVLSNLAERRGPGSQQWLDILSIVAVQRERLDRDYMGRWARYLKVEDLLERALA